MASGENLRHAVMSLLQRFKPPIQLELFCLAFKNEYKIDFPHIENECASPAELLVKLCSDYIDIIRESEGKSGSTSDLVIIPKLPSTPKKSLDEIPDSKKTNACGADKQPVHHSPPSKKVAVPLQFRTMFSKYLANYPNGVEMDILTEEFQRLTGNSLNHEVCGFKTLPALLKSLSDICVVDEIHSKVYAKGIEKRNSTSAIRRTEGSTDSEQPWKFVRRFELTGTSVITVLYRNMILVPTSCVAMMAGLKEDNVVEYLKISCVDIRNMTILRDDDTEQAKIRREISLLDCFAINGRKSRNETCLIPIESVGPLVAALRSHDEKFDREIEAIRVALSKSRQLVPKTIRLS